MKSFAAAVLLAACFALPATADDEPIGPSFDCAKATTTGEKTVCDAPGLGWYDRQLAKAYGIARKAAGPRGEEAVKASQKRFIEIRDTCRGEDPYGCVLKAYQERLTELSKIAGAASFDYGDYDSENGSLSLARYADNSAAVSISTVGGGDHTCAFETDRAKSDAAGKISYAAKYEGMEESCEITGTPKGDSLTIEASGGCSYWCGMRAQLDGTYKRQGP